MSSNDRTLEPPRRTRRRRILIVAAATGVVTGIVLLARRGGEVGVDERARVELHEQASQEAQTAGTTDAHGPDAGDDLKVVEGIGPRLERVLKEAGVSTYARLAELRPNRLETIMREAGTRRAKPDTWPEQARLAAQGRWQALKDLQAGLKRGAPAS